MAGLIIGTAGHVDHGKTALIQALTGVDTDRLREEKERGLSIDLGFALLTLPSGEQAGVIDVPGHERFMANMLAGVAGMDVVLLIIDLQEGIMPQTREHLEVIRLLDIKKGIVVLTKADLVDEEWIELMQAEVEEELAGTVFGNCPIVVTSARDRRGLDELLALLDQVAKDRKTLRAEGPIRLPVDRVFQLTGLGTVITGTLLSGNISTGDEVEVAPVGLKTKVRQIQVHNRKVDRAFAGQRVALNLPIERASIARGYVIATPGAFPAITRMDVELKLLADFPHSLKNNDRVHFHLGTARTIARVRLYDQKEVIPGEKALAQLELQAGMLAVFRDLFIIRFYSPVQVMGGGRVLVTNPPPFRRRDREYRQLLARLTSGEPRDLLFQVLYRRALISEDELRKESQLPPDDFHRGLQALEADVLRLGEGYLVLKENYGRLMQPLLRGLEEYHATYNLRLGLPKSNVLSLLPKTVDQGGVFALTGHLKQNNRIEVAGNFVALKGFKPQPMEEQREKMQVLLKRLAAGGFSPPLVAEMDAQALEYLLYLQHQGEVIKVTDDFFLTADRYQKAYDLLVAHLKEKETITVAEYRTRLESSRKYALPLLEHFDERKITRRRGDYRVPGPAFPAQ